MGADEGWIVIRFFLNWPIRDLADAALKRLAIASEGETACLLFLIESFARDYAKCIAKDHLDAVILEALEGCIKENI